MSAGQVRLQEIQKVCSDLLREWCVQAAEIILAARIDHPGPAGSPQQTSASFNLKVPELFNVRNEALARAEFFQLRTQRSFQVEIYVKSEDEEAVGEEGGQLLERWTFTFLPAAAQPDPTAQLDRHNQTLVRRLSVVLRTLLFFVRLLPAHGLCRSASSGDPAGHVPPARYHRFRVEAWPPASRTSPVQELVSQDFVTLPSTAGSLRLSVAQRKDLKCLSSAGPLKGVAAISSQMDKIDMEEGFFAQGPSATGSVSAETARSKLDKIAEEPEVRPAGEVSKLLTGGLAEGQPQPPAACFEPGVRTQVPERPESPAQSASTSSRAASTSAPAVVLDATPPLAAAGAALPGHPLSLSSSRSHTPLPTPCSTPHQEPAAEPTQGSAVGANAERPAPPAAAESKSLAPSGPGELDDLSNIWMSNLPEWGRRRSMSFDGSRGGTSRSVSPEDPSRGPSLGDLLSSGRVARGSAASVSSGTARYPHESEGEICLFGMSDDEEERNPSDEDDVERNVVASAIMEGGGGGAFATASTRLDLSKLGLSELESEQPGLSRRSSGAQASPKQRFSPLIAQLNPFQPPPSLDLPPGHAVAQALQSDAAGAEEEGASSGTDPKEAGVGLLVEQMGDLVCRLQQRQDLAIFSEEMYPEELLKRLDHFREVAQGLAAN